MRIVEECNCGARIETEDQFSPYAERVAREFREKHQHEVLGNAAIEAIVHRLGGKLIRYQRMESEEE